MAHKLAIESEHITADVIDAMEFPELANKYNVYGVPKTVINDDVEFEGALPEPQFVAYVLEAAERTHQTTAQVPDIEE